MRKRISVLFLVLFLVLGCSLLLTAAAPPPGESTSGRPYFWFFYVVAENTAGGMTTSLGVKVVDPDGSVPDSIASLTVSGPNNFHYDFVPGDFRLWWGLPGEYWNALPGLPADGEYTVTATDVNGNQAKSYTYLTVGQTIPLPDSSTFQASGTDPLTPTLSWSAIPGYSGNLFYRARIYNDANDTVVFDSGRNFNSNSIKVPSGPLVTGKSYSWRVSAYDNNLIGNLNNIASPPRVPLTLDNSRPYFTQVAAFKTHHLDGTFWTGLTYGGGSFGKPVSLDVTGPNGFHVTYPECLRLFPGKWWRVLVSPRRHRRSCGWKLCLYRNR